MAGTSDTAAEDLTFRLWDELHGLLQRARQYHDRGQPTPEPLHREILEAQAAYLKATGWERPQYPK